MISTSVTMLDTIFLIALSQALALNGYKIASAAVLFIWIKAFPAWGERRTFISHPPSFKSPVYRGLMTIPEQNNRRVMGPGANQYISQQREQIQTCCIYNKSTKHKRLFTSSREHYLQPIHRRPGFTHFDIIKNTTKSRHILFFYPQQITLQLPEITPCWIRISFREGKT